jgi:hypothetical protein
VNSKSTSGTVEITIVGKEIEVHCISGDFDYTMMLNYYRDGDFVRTCLTGEDFQNMYGHMLGQGNTMGNHMQGSSSEWMQHLGSNHQDGDEHFGHFNMQNGTFECRFEYGNIQYSFQGNK